MQSENQPSKPKPVAKQETGEGCLGATCSGFLIEMRDGSQYLIPTAKFIEAEISDTLYVWNKEMEQTGEETPATNEQARKWAEDKFARPWHSADIDDLFAGTQWSEFADIAVKLPTQPLSPDDLWDETAEISFIPNIVKSPDSEK